MTDYIKLNWLRAKTHSESTIIHISDIKNHPAKTSSPGFSALHSSCLNKDYLGHSEKFDIHESSLMSLTK